MILNKKATHSGGFFFALRSGLFSHRFLKDLDRIWELRKYLPVS